MTDWHREMQELFDLDCREVEILGAGRRHRADVVCASSAAPLPEGRPLDVCTLRPLPTVIEMQHSGLHVTTVLQREAAYRRLVWIADGRGRAKIISPTQIQIRRGLAFLLHVRRRTYIDLGGPIVSGKVVPSEGGRRFMLVRGRLGNRIFGRMVTREYIVARHGRFSAAHPDVNIWYRGAIEDTKQYRAECSAIRKQHPDAHREKMLAYAELNELHEELERERRERTEEQREIDEAEAIQIASEAARWGIGECAPGSRAAGYESGDDDPTPLDEANSFCRLPDDTWGVKVSHRSNLTMGATVSVRLKDGSITAVVLGGLKHSSKWGNIHSIA